MPDDNAKIIEAIGELSSKVDQRFENVEASIKDRADKSLEQHEETRLEFRQMRGHIAKLWRKVNGSDPPPPTQKKGPDGRVIEESPFRSSDRPEGEDEDGEVPLDELAKEGFRMASNADMEIAALRSETMTEFARVAKKIDKIAAVNKEQSDYAGIGKKGRKYLFSREGIKATATLIAAVTGLVAAIGTCYALVRQPSPTLPLPTHESTSQAQHP